MYVGGSTVYLVGPGSPEGDASQAVTVTVTAYNVSGEQPALLWSSTGPSASHVSSPYTPAFVSSDDSVFFRDVITDKTTGEQTQAPWGAAFPLAYADGILVTCTAVHLQRVYEGVRRVDDPVDNTNRAAE